MMDNAQRIQLKQMIDSNDVVDHTEQIRRLKHSQKLSDQIRILQQLKFTHKGDLDKVHADGISACHFLFTNYTDIYNKVKNDEIDLQLLNQFLNVLQRIENNEMDQHEASYLVGTILKEIYVDSALKKGDKLDNEHGEGSVALLEPVVDVSWSQFKKKMA
jgi:dimeric dUTPase (all-alpha-NTP-PPase superfamily)